MTNKQAHERAVKAIQKAYNDTEHFRGGDFASHEVMEVLRDALRAEFLSQRGQQ